ncbi:SDR family NAD(P)-dependent oxidoreductase [Burkholderia sp. 22313]|uniref:SDR family NAD(P)-dependent oxidoreductase n=1 Tax=Burkholderia sp. 22313 TaxID=3453908 RepID=UPI003F85983D
MTVVVTGAASGIGHATAIRFAEAGYAVCGADMNQEGLAQTSEAIAAKGASSPLQSSTCVRKAK